MAYKLFGMAVWKAGKWLLRGRSGSAMVPKSLLAGGLLLGLGGIALAVARGRGLGS